MKFLIAFALIAAASAFVVPAGVNVAEIEEIINSINSPSTDPATAAVLEQMLHDLLGIKPAPIDIGPAIVNPEHEIDVNPALVKPEGEGINIGPALVKPEGEGINIGPALVKPEGEGINIGPALVKPEGGGIAIGPAYVAPDVPVGPAGLPFKLNSPLVQVIVNVDSASSDAVTVEQLEPTPGADELHDINVDPALVIDEIEAETISIADPIIPDPVVIVDEIEAEPISIADPIIPDNAANLPEQLN